MMTSSDIFRSGLPKNSSHDTPNIREKPTVVGVYGIQGAGKTTLHNGLRRELGERDFLFLDGSDVIKSIVDGGLDVFKSMKASEKSFYRKLAIQEIGKRCLLSGRIGVVTGHATFWSEEEQTAYTVYTETDLQTYTHILHLQVDPQTIFMYRKGDANRQRSSLSVPILHKWQETERTTLQDVCRAHGILLSTLPDLPLDEKTAHVALLLRDIRDHSEKENVCRVMRRLDGIIAPVAHMLDTVLLFDADKTLAAIDTGVTFWNERLEADYDEPLRRLFSHQEWMYSYKSFRQATWLYEGIPEAEFDRLCINVAKQVVLHPELDRLLRAAGECQNVRVIVVTCGIRRIWDEVLRRVGLSKSVEIIGGGRISDGFVVTPNIKSTVVTCLQQHYHLRVCAFGDSGMDMPMLQAADEAFVISGDIKNRSKSMDSILRTAIREGCLRASQVLLPPDSPNRLEEGMLPIVVLDDSFLPCVLNRPKREQSTPRKVHATETAAAKLLMTPMRDANIAGPALREAHRRVGWWLATQLLAQEIGVESCPLLHVQGHQADGFRLLGEEKSTIAALMRGGEPMAFGVSEAFPTAMFIHAKEPRDVRKQHIEGQKTLLLVDSVVNTGNTVVEFVEHIRALNKNVRIVVVAGVIHEKFFDKPPVVVAENVTLVALRVSHNKFTGRGGTDTGNRLFNTMQHD